MSSTKCERVGRFTGVEACAAIVRCYVKWCSECPSLCSRESQPSDQRLSGKKRPWDRSFILFERQSWSDNNEGIMGAIDRRLTQKDSEVLKVFRDSHSTRGAAIDSGLGL